MDNGESIGVVSGAYFVGRTQLLQWINELTHLNYTKIEQTSNGVFACHVFDALYPDLIRFDKVKFYARQQYEVVHNYKILQACFNRANMKRQIDVEKLMKGKYQDNLEFIQWIKAYYESHATEDAINYNGRARREEVLANAASASATSSRSTLPDIPAKRSTASVKSPSTPSARPALRTRPKAGGVRGGGAKATKPSGGVNRTQVTELKQQVEELTAENERLEGVVTDTETDREFYFNKLRKVEVIIQSTADEIKEGQDSIEMLRDILEDIKAALYAEDDEVVDPPADQPYDEGEFEEEQFEGGAQAA